MGVSVVVVGTSLGGLSAMKVLLSGLPREFRPPIVIVQHRGKTADDALVELLRKQTPLPVSEPNDKELLEARPVLHRPRRLSSACRAQKPRALHRSARKLCPTVHRCSLRVSGRDPR